MVNKKELEEKRRKEEEDAAHVFEEFIETFQQPTDKSIINKVWVKSGIFNGREDTQPSEQTVYKPSSRFRSSDSKSAVQQAQECARMLLVDRKKSDNLNKRKKSNLESFKEELEQIHKEREERQKQKAEPIVTPTESEISSGETNDPLSTNLYVNNLNPKVTELTLMELFGSFGPLASVKIMWPRSDEEKTRSKNYCGFVAFMSKKDAERALSCLNNSKFMDFELKVGWGKPVLLPAHPLYIPPALLELSQPPPNSGLPFNAQPVPHSGCSSLKDCIVKVVIPTNRNVLMLIHRMIEFVIREGVLFEAIMMTREINNPLFSFLFDNQSSAHIYYRWKLYSILQGDSLKQWRTKEFRMFTDGPIWQPPKIIDYTQGMPNDLVEQHKKPLVDLKKTLSNTQRDNLEYIIHKLTPERKKIIEALVYCVDHSDAADEIVECLVQSLESKSASVKKIIARLYLVHDLLYNSRTVEKAQLYGTLIQNQSDTILNILKTFYETLANNEKRIFYLKIGRVFTAWNRLKLLPSVEIDSIYKTFMNIATNEDTSIDYDGPSNNQNILPETIPVVCEPPKPEKTLGFAPSRWETVDPDVIESQAMTTSKWTEYMDEKLRTQEVENKREISEEKRKKLREIELLVMEYQDSLESTSVKPKGSVMEKVEEYRTKLIKEYEKKEKYHHKKHKKKRKSRSRSPKRKYSKHC